MALLTAGYWCTTYWADSYWADDYWPDWVFTLASDRINHGLLMGVY